MSHKVQPVFFDEGKMIRLSDLPSTQAGLFSGWISKRDLIRPEGIGECVKYEHYDYWYEYHFQAERDLDYFI